MPQFNRDGLSGLRCAEVEPRHLTILEVAECDGCRWPFGNGPYTFCGLARVDREIPYCLDHLALSVGSGTATERAAHRIKDVA